MGTAHVIPELALRALGGEDPLRVYSCDHTRAFCYVSDAIRATIAAMRSPAADGRTLNIGTTEEVEIGELARNILRELDIKIEVEPRTAKHDPIRRRCPDCSLARELLGYEPEVPLHEGLRPTLEWYAARAEAGR
jgi:UDP-glucose 4-epimerase/UDP-glucuronate decarboxylase